MQEQRKKGISSRSSSVLTVLYLLYLIGTLGERATHQTLCEYLHLSYPTLHRHLRLLREAYEVDIRSKRLANNSTHFYIESWGVFTEEHFLQKFRDSLLETSQKNLSQKI